MRPLNNWKHSGWLTPVASTLLPGMKRGLSASFAAAQWEGQASQAPPPFVHTWGCPERVWLSSHHFYHTLKGASLFLSTHLKDSAPAAASSHSTPLTSELSESCHSCSPTKCCYLCLHSVLPQPGNAAVLSGFPCCCGTSLDSLPEGCS